MVNRKLIRPNLAELKERMTTPNRSPVVSGGPPAAGHPASPHRDAPASAPRQEGGVPQHHGPRRRPVPPDQTSAEAFYYVKQMNAHTPMVVVLDDGQRLRGHIEWYDRNCIKVHRQDAPNLLIFKHAIKYLYKQEEEGRGESIPEQGAVQ